MTKTDEHKAPQKLASCRREEKEGLLLQGLSTGFGISLGITWSVKTDSPSQSGVASQHYQV